MATYTIDEMKTKINIALQILYKNDSFLISNCTEERTITHKLAEYIQDLFPEWHVDCEYNRLGEGGTNAQKPVNNQNTSYPDIIIHLRNTKENQLVIEAKNIHSRNHSDTNDKLKIKGYIEDERYNYNFGLWILFKDNLNEVQQDWFKKENGICISA